MTINTCLRRTKKNCDGWTHYFFTLSLYNNLVCVFLSFYRTIWTIIILKPNVIKLENVCVLEMWCCARSTHRSLPQISSSRTNILNWFCNSQVQNKLLPNKIFSIYNSPNNFLFFLSPCFYIQVDLLFRR